MKPKPYNRTKRYFLELSRSQLFFSVLGFLIIIGWVFVLGIFIGRGYFPEAIVKNLKNRIDQLEKEKEELKERYLPRTQTPETSKEESSEPPLGFYRQVKEPTPTLELIPKPAPAPAPTEPAFSPQAQGPASGISIPNPVRPQNPATSKTEKGGEVKDLHSKADSGTTAAMRPTSGGQEPEGDRFIVQIGSYRQEAVARSAADRLITKGYPARVRSKDLPQKGGRWYRIQIGPFPSRAEAEKTMTRLAHDGFHGVVLRNDF